MPRQPNTGVQELKIGPFAGGINAYSDPAMIADDEMVDCVNFDLSLDGSLVSRPPWFLKYIEYNLSSSSNPEPPDSHQIVIGTGTYEGKRFIIVNSAYKGSPASYIVYVDGENAGLVAKIADGIHSKVHRYGDDLYLVPDINSTGSGARYDLNGGLVTLIPSMPQGYTSCIYKDRLWIGGRRSVANSSRLYFSDLADFETWPGTNFFDINPGDGDAVNALTVYQDNIIIFKDNATYVLTYDSGPAQAVLQVINTTVGAMGRDCVDVFENSIFVLKYNKVYEMSNYDFVDISVKVPFEFDDTLPEEGNFVTPGQKWKYPIWLRTVGERLVVRFYNRLYVYHLRLRAWTRWDSNDPNIKYLGPIMRLDNTNTSLLRGFNTYVACSSLLKAIDVDGPGEQGEWFTNLKIFFMEDRYEDSNEEYGDEAVESYPISLFMTTKQFDVGLSHRFKRLLHWGVDCYTVNNVVGTVIPYTVAYKVTWNQLAIYKWSQLLTWGNPISAIPSVSQEIQNDSGPTVKFIRFPMALRFKLLQFKLEMETMGNKSDGPVYIYSITAFIGAKQLVPKAVN